MHARFIWHLAIGALALLHLHAPIAGARATAARVNQSWEALVGSVPPGTRLALLRRDSTAVEGRLAAIDVRSIVLKRKQFVPEMIEFMVEIDAEDVMRVERAGVRSRRVLRRGLPIGAAAGALLVWAIDQRSGYPQPDDAIAMGALFLGLPGGAIVAGRWPAGPPLFERPNVMTATGR